MLNNTKESRIVLNLDKEDAKAMYYYFIEVHQKNNFVYPDRVDTQRIEKIKKRLDKLINKHFPDSGNSFEKGVES